MSGIKEVTLNNGQKVKLSGQSLDEYVAWRDAMLRQTGQDLAANFPKLYGKISFNIQNGKFVNWNMTLGGK